MNGSMIIDNLDLNYLGILSVWKANLGRFCLSLYFLSPLLAN